MNGNLVNIPIKRIIQENNTLQNIQSNKKPLIAGTVLGAGAGAGATMLATAGKIAKNNAANQEKLDHAHGALQAANKNINLHRENAARAMGKTVASEDDIANE